MNLIPHLALPVTLALSLSASGATTTLVDDTSFISSDWSTLKLTDSTPSGDASVGASQYPAGGDPEAYRGVSHSWDVVPTGVIISFAHIQQATYIPTVQGSIDFISFSLSVMCDYAPIVNAIAYGALVEQDGAVYIYSAASATAIVGAGWTDFAFNNLSASNFTNASPGGSGNPDFSSGGSPLRFGFWSANGGSGFSNTNHLATGGVDNFLVTAEVSPIPEPSGVILLGLSGGAALALRRRGRISV